MSNNYHPNSCPGCKHYDGGGYDSDTGYSQNSSCDAAYKLYEGGDCTEQVSLMFEAILFKLSDLNNCPLRKEPSRSILDIRRTKTAA